MRSWRWWRRLIHTPHKDHAKVTTGRTCNNQQGTRLTSRIYLRSDHFHNKVKIYLLIASFQIPAPHLHRLPLSCPDVQRVVWHAKPSICNPCVSSWRTGSASFRLGLGTKPTWFCSWSPWWSLFSSLLGESCACPHSKPDILPSLWFLTMFKTALQWRFRLDPCASGDNISIHDIYFIFLVVF